LAWDSQPVASEANEGIKQTFPVITAGNPAYAAERSGGNTPLLCGCDGKIFIELKVKNQIDGNRDFDRIKI